MDVRIHQHFHTLVSERAKSPRRALEVGGLISKNSLLTFPELANADRVVLNLQFKHASVDSAIRPVTGNANDMNMFEDGEFDLVMSNALLEHDPYFWKTIYEMHRVLAPGGLLIIGVPGFAVMPNDKGLKTETFKIHNAPGDYYRFSPQAKKEVFFEGFEDIRSDTLFSPPRIVTSGIRPS